MTPRARKLWSAAVCAREAAEHLKQWQEEGHNHDAYSSDRADLLDLAERLTQASKEYDR